MTVTGVAAYHMTNVSFSHSSMILCSTHLPGIVIALSQSGVFYILNLNDSVSLNGYMITCFYGIVILMEINVAPEKLNGSQKSLRISMQTESYEY